MNSNKVVHMSYTDTDRPDSDEYRQTFLGYHAVTDPPRLGRVPPGAAQPGSEAVDTAVRLVCCRNKA